MTRTEKDLIMAQVMILTTIVLAVLGIWWLVNKVIQRTEARDVERAKWAQELRDNGCKRTGYVPRGPLVQELYTCPDGSTFLGEFK